MPAIHFDIEPFQCFIHKEFLYDFRTGFEELSPCKVFAVSSYPGHALTFHVLVEDRYIYSYIPAHALCTNKRVDVLPIRDASYFNCPSEDLKVHSFVALRGPCQVFNRDETFRGSGIYKMSFDWHNDNQLCHLIEENGSLILWPSHKVIFSSNKHDTLPGYKKLHKEWKL